MGARDFRRMNRCGGPSAEEVARDEEIRHKVQGEFPPARPASPPTPDSLVETLKQAIQQSDRPVLELAKEAGVSKNLVTQFLSGDRDIPVTIADRLANVLGLSLSAGKK